MARARLAAVVAILLVGGGLAAAYGATDGDGLRAPRPVKWAKLSSPLATVLREQLENGRGLAVARSNGLRVVDGRVLVVVETDGTRTATIEKVRALRGRVVATYAGLVQAFVPPVALGALSRSPEISYLRAPRAPVADGSAVVTG